MSTVYHRMRSTRLSQQFKSGSMAFAIIAFRMNKTNSSIASLGVSYDCLATDGVGALWTDCYDDIRRCLLPEFASKLRLTNA